MSPASFWGFFPLPASRDSGPKPPPKIHLLLGVWASLSQGGVLETGCSVFLPVPAASAHPLCRHSLSGFTDLASKLAPSWLVKQLKQFSSLLLLLLLWPLCPLKRYKCLYFQWTLKRTIFFCFLWPLQGQTAARSSTWIRILADKKQTEDWFEHEGLIHPEGFALPFMQHLRCYSSTKTLFVMMPGSWNTRYMH